MPLINQIIICRQCRVSCMDCPDIVMPEFFLINPQHLLEQLRASFSSNSFHSRLFVLKMCCLARFRMTKYVYMSHHTWYRRTTATSRCEILQARLIITPKPSQVISVVCYRIFFGTCNSSSVLVPEFQRILALPSSIVNKLLQECGFLVCSNAAVNLKGVLGINAGGTFVVLAL